MSAAAAAASVSETAASWHCSRASIRAARTTCSGEVSIGKSQTCGGFLLGKIPISNGWWLSQQELPFWFTVCYEKCPFSLLMYPIKILIFHSYVSLPEGSVSTIQLWWQQPYQCSTRSTFRLAVVVIVKELITHKCIMSVVNQLFKLRDQLISGCKMEIPNHGFQLGNSRSLDGLGVPPFWESFTLIHTHVCLQPILVFCHRDRGLNPLDPFTSATSWNSEVPSVQDFDGEKRWWTWTNCSGSPLSFDPQKW